MFLRVNRDHLLDRETVPFYVTQKTLLKRSSVEYSIKFIQPTVRRIYYHLFITENFKSAY